MKTISTTFISQLMIFFFLLLPSIHAQPGWYLLNSGTTNNLRGVMFADANTGYVVGDNGTVLKTTDGGVNWSSLSVGTSQNLNRVYVFNADHAVVVGDGGFSAYTTDGGANWTATTTGVADNLLSVSFNGSNLGIAGGTSQTIIASTDAGATWSVIQTGFFGGGFWGAYVNPSNDYIYVFGKNAIFQPLFGSSTDGGSNWFWNAFYFNSNEGTGYDVFFFDANNGIVCGSLWDGQGAIALTSDGGANWSTSVFPLVLFSLDFPSPTVGYAVGLSGFILKTTDGGVNWVTQGSMATVDLRDVDFVDNIIGYAVGDNGTIIKTEDGGIIPVELTSFTAFADNQNVRLKWTTATETNNNGFEIERNRNNDAQEWERIGFVEGNGTTTEPHSYSFEDEVEEPGSYFYRLKQIDYDGSFEYSSVIEVDVKPITEFSLSQNYPNPFNPSTKIKFNIPSPYQGEGQRVRFTTLKVYDVLGNEVATLVNEEKPAGTYEVEFDASNLSSGIYYYQLKAGSFIQTKKMILMK